MTGRIDAGAMAASRGASPGGAALPDLTDLNEMRATSSARIVWLVAVLLAVFFAWAMAFTQIRLKGFGLY